MPVVFELPDKDAMTKLYGEGWEELDRDTWGEFLVWIYLSNSALMPGVEINAEVQRGRQLQAGAEDPDPPLPPREEPKDDSV